MAFKRLFDDKFITDKERKSDYRKWSERAIIVGYNGDTQTYDIVITAEKLIGNNKKTLNKTIRNVKSTLPGITFSPGDLVLVGYIRDQREHPIILGAGGIVTQEAATVTIGESESVVEGGGPEITPPSENPGFLNLNCEGELIDSLTGSTTTLTIDCTNLDILGCAEAEIEAPTDCGCGVYDWTVSGVSGLTITDQGASAQAIAGFTTTVSLLNSAGTKVKICPQIPKGGSGVLSHYYTARAQDSNNCANFGTVCYSVSFDCQDVFLNTNGSDTFFCQCKPGVCPPTQTGGSQCATSLANFPACQSPGTQSCVGLCDPPFGAVGFFNFGIRTRFGITTSCRTQALINSGCAPCSVEMNDSIITATDACGRMISLTIEAPFS